ncbi:hypothetical protein [Micromonospora sp. NPDC049891]|uniref:hypothetical protein n=1 Tax=Micromonospora sp. NPDC049891 TaxID=3155655 RepID=UPI0033FC6818
MVESPSGPSESPRASTHGPQRADNRLPASSFWRVTIAALLGALVGTVIGVTWRALTESDRPSEDIIALTFLAWLVGLPVLLVVSWVVLALTGPAWVAPTVTIAGLAAGAYVEGLYQKATGSSDATPVAICALAWGACYTAVALACLPGLSRAVRIALAALLITPAILFLVL